TLNNPPVNALNTGVLELLQEKVELLAPDRELGAVIITGSGDKAFVAGADISQFPSLDRAGGVEFSQRGQRVFQQVATLPVPVIAAINGFALGGGLELALACDIRIASENARLGLPEVTLGIMPGYGATLRLPRIISPGKARELIYSGKQISAAEALRIGLVEEVVPVGEALDKAKELASAILRCGPLGVRAAKRAVDRGRELPLAEGLKYEATAFGDLFDTEDKDEGARAFLEKRRPKFKGR
ncbi:MAG: enoyl-CoA hydratase, partial [Firmicutes bacterium]|nr:enoyl-CoA hydratase [Bacillota bacterium]